MEKCLNLLNDLNIKKKKLIVGLSAGPDSMFLFEVLIKNNYDFVVAHVNYNKRKESLEEEIFLEQLCKNNDIAFEKKSIKKYSKKNFQEEARNIRYDFFKKIADKYKTKYILTAHHGDDLVETILMRITRGSVFSGYIGFREMSEAEGYIYVRPLIEHSKDEIVDYLKQQSLKYYIDESNLSDDYTRNRFRKKIIPILKEENPQLIDKINQFSSALNTYDKYILKETKDIFDKEYKNNILNLSKFNFIDEVIQEKIIELILKEIYQNDVTLLTRINVLDILKIIQNKRPNASISLPNKLIVRKSYDKIFFEFEAKKNVVEYEYIIDKKIVLPNGDIIRLSDENKDKSNYSIYLNKNDIELPLLVRNRKNGDKIIVKNSGTQKVKDIFIDEKLDIKNRDTYPIVIDSSNKILWLPGIKKSIYDCNDEYDIILEYIKKGK